METVAEHISAVERTEPPGPRTLPAQAAFRPWVDVHAWRLLAPAVVLTLLGFAALGIDQPLARWLIGGHLPDFLGQLVQASEPFGHGVGIALIAIVVWTLDAARRRDAVRLLVAAWSAGLAANLGKLTIERARPFYWNVLPHDQAAWTFGQWFPLGESGSQFQSFPSGHAASAAALAFGLAAMYPRGRWVFAVLAVLVAMQRLEFAMHFLSDVLWGAALGWAVAVAFFRGHLGALFDRWEGRCTTQPSPASKRPHFGQQARQIAER